MRHSMRTIDWSFRDISNTYPQIAHQRIKLNSPAEAYHSFKFLFHRQVKERFVVSWLNTANVVMGFEIISEGILNCSLVHPREVFRGAIVATCASILLMHNHPSGNPEPSQEDIAITRQLVETGKILGIPVVDHLIFCDDSFTSFAERNLI